MFDIKAIALDFDGVILESADIKTEAFKELFSGYPEQLDTIIEYHNKNAGISRYLKFKHIYKYFIIEQYSPEIENELDEKFRDLVLDKIMKSPFIEGTLEFLNKYHTEYPLYIVSGTPDHELKEIIQRRGLNNYFVNVFGSSKMKSDWLDRIVVNEKIRPDNLLFVGDAESDYLAGLASKTLFIGKINDGDNIFPKENILGTVNNLNELIYYIEENNRLR